MPVISATWEAETGESLKPGKQRLLWAKITPLHSSLDNKIKTKEIKNRAEINEIENKKTIKNINKI